LEGVECGDATDIVYLAFGADDEESEGETERLGVILVAYQDGRVDVCLDVDKAEARWETKSVSDEWTKRSPSKRLTINSVTLRTGTVIYQCLQFTRRLISD
jgi:hypothetical protein